MNSCSTSSTSSRNNSFLGDQNSASKTKIKQAMLFEQILAFSTTSASSKFLHEKVQNGKSRALHSVGVRCDDADVESDCGTTINANEHKDYQHQTTTSSIISADSESFSDISGARDSFSISSSNLKDEDTTTSHQSNLSDAFSRMCFTTTSTTSTNKFIASRSVRHNILGVFHDFMLFRI
jgi:hypothetical protein